MNPFDSTETQVSADSAQQYLDETYYGLPALKPAPFGWHVPAYIFLTAVGASAQVIASIADGCGGTRLRSVARKGRLIALATALVGPALLVRDLKTPRRFYNMLRIFRHTSAMSIGSFVLTGFGATSAGAAIAEATRDKPAPLLLNLAAAGTGTGMLSYTGALLSGTSTPLWSAQSPLLSARFAASGMACGAAALAALETLSGHSENAAALEKLGITATLVYAGLTARAEAKASAAHVASPLEKPPYGSMSRLSKMLSVAVPLACYALRTLAPGRARPLSLIAAASTLAGSALGRGVEYYAGKASAKRPRDYFRQANRSHEGRA